MATRALIAVAAVAFGLLGVLAWQAPDLAPLAAQSDASTRAAFAVISHAGDPALLWALAIGVGTMLWWRGDRELALRWALALAGNGLTVRAIKLLLARARPSDADALTSISGASFPSGHAAGAWVAWGLIGVIALVHAQPRGRARALFAASLCLALAVGWSRWVIGAHHLSDVIGGWLCGIAWIALALLGWRHPPR